MRHIDSAGVNYSNHSIYKQVSFYKVYCNSFPDYLFREISCQWVFIYVQREPTSLQIQCLMFWLAKHKNGITGTTINWEYCCTIARKSFLLEDQSLAVTLVNWQFSSKRVHKYSPCASGLHYRGSCCLWVCVRLLCPCPPYMTRKHCPGRPSPVSVSHRCRPSRCFCSLTIF